MNEMIKIANKLKYDVVKWNRFNYTNAYISNKLEGRYYLIKSYYTIVGMVNEEQKKFFEFGKYSPTTSKQITQINRDRFGYCERIFINETNW